MPFNYQLFQRWSSGFSNAGNAEWNYKDTSIDYATMSASGFFNPVNTNPDSPVVNIGDVMWFDSSDKTTFVKVTAIDPDITVTEVTGGGGGLPVMTDGQLIIGVTGSDPVAADLTAGSGITITPGAGTLEISANSGATINGNPNNILINADYGPNTVNLAPMPSGYMYLGNGAGSPLASPLTSSNQSIGIALDFGSCDITVSPFKTITIPAADFKQIFTTPYLLVDSGTFPNTGYLYVTFATLFINYNSIQYAGGGNFYLIDSNNTVLTVPVAASLINNWNVSSMVGMQCLISNGSYQFSGTNIYLTCDTQNFTTGDSDIVVQLSVFNQSPLPI